MNEEKIKLYFLGKLAEPDAEKFEIETAESEDLTEQAQMIERELIDSYLRNDLSVGEKLSFENNYLITEVRRGKAADAQNIWKIAAENQEINDFVPIIAISSRKSVWQMIFGHRTQVAFGGLILVFLIGGIIWVWKNSEGRRELTSIQNSGQIPAPLDQEQKNILTPTITDKIDKRTDKPTDLTNSSALNNESNKKIPPSLPKPEAKTRLKAIEPPISSLASFVLMPGTLRDGDGEQFIKIEPQAGKIALHLGLPPNAEKFRMYRAVLKNADGEDVLISANMKTPEFILSAGKLENRTYMIFLEGQNAGKESQSIAEYTFRVRR